MSKTTTDPNDPRIVRRAPDTEPTGQHEVYFVRTAVGSYVRLVYDQYIYTACQKLTSISQDIAQTYARAIHIFTLTRTVYIVNSTALWKSLIGLITTEQLAFK